MDQNFDNDNQNNVSVHAGFPNPAGYAKPISLNLNQLLISHPSATFIMRIVGDSWAEQGIFDSDLAVVDRALSPQKSDRVIWWNDENFAISTYKNLNPGMQIWGIVTSIIHPFRKVTL